MIDLQTSLIIVGGTIVVGIVGYNKWNDYRAKRNVERAFSSDRDDVLMRPPEPASNEVSTVANAEDRQEPVFLPQDFDLPDTTGVADVVAGAVQYGDKDVDRVDRAAPVADERIDCLIPLLLEKPVVAEPLLPQLRDLRHVGNKPVHFMGYTENHDTKIGSWKAIKPGNIYTEIKAAVQLANRSSGLNELEYSELVMKLRQIADELGAELDVPDMPQVMAEARSLRQFVIDHDAKLGINVRSNGAPWAISTLLATLERQGFDLRTDGRFVMRDDEGAILFVLSVSDDVAAEHTSRLTLLLDVPCVPPLKDGFGVMVENARSLAKLLDGTIVDDANQYLSTASLEEIAAQVNEFYQDMAQSGIPAGSARALRLFS